MFKFEADENMISVQKIQGWDYNGKPELQVRVEPGHQLIQMQQDLQLLMSKVATMEGDAQIEKQLRERNPAVKDLYDQYKTVLNLVKNPPVEANDGGG